MPYRPPRRDADGCDDARALIRARSPVGDARPATGDRAVDRPRAGDRRRPLTRDGDWRSAGRPSTAGCAAICVTRGARAVLPRRAGELQAASTDRRRRRRLDDASASAGRDGTSSTSAALVQLDGIAAAADGAEPVVPRPGRGRAVDLAPAHRRRDRDASSASRRASASTLPAAGRSRLLARIARWQTAAPIGSGRHVGSALGGEAAAALVALEGQARRARRSARRRGGRTRPTASGTSRSGVNPGIVLTSLTSRPRSSSS